MSTLTSLLQHKVKKSSKKPLQWLRKATLAQRPLLSGPYGEHDALPCDFSASGGTLKIVDKYIAELVEPVLEKEQEGSVLAKKKLVDSREEARRFIHKAANCSEDHVVMFTEDQKFEEVFLSYLHALDIPRLCQHGRKLPMVLLGHDLYESLHADVRRLGADLSEIQFGSNGQYDMKKLEALLKFYKKQERVVIGAFSVGDEITGVLNDTQQMTAMLHAYGALAVWDYTSAGAYTKIEMCPLVSYEGLTFKDAAFIQTSQFLGGEEASGVFITTSNLLKNSMFETVFEGILSVSCVEGSVEKSLAPHSTTEALSSLTARRKLVGGPLRARCAFELKGYFGDCYLQKRTLEIAETLSRGLLTHPSIHVVGKNYVTGTDLPYLSLFFFHPHTEWALHHGFVVALLQDLFGIMALPHRVEASHLPETPMLESQRFMHMILSGDGEIQFTSERIMHVGCVHFSLMYFMRDIDLDFLAAAIQLVAEDGWRLLPFYRYNVATGKWIMPHNLINKTERLSGTMTKLRQLQSSAQSARYRHVAYVDRARKLIDSITSKTIRKTLKDGQPQGDEGMSDAAKGMRWFMTPQDAGELLEDASPVRLAKSGTGTKSGERRRTWPGTKQSTPLASPAAFRSRQLSSNSREF